jgi:hypothetical protein
MSIIMEYRLSGSMEARKKATRGIAGQALPLELAHPAAGPMAAALAPGGEHG